MEIEDIVNTFEAVLNRGWLAARMSISARCRCSWWCRASAARISEEQATHCRTHPSAYKVAKAVGIVAEVPRTGSGKIIRYKPRWQSSA